ncbi:hypothetical protein C2845_PM08G03890 [Panicum miliaceum]|uniref:Uncharacterized protein n=1 Tax=Panicum miliaceum TaxID=4540 RepID=A0A3L6R4Z0_PANMI|nr:hypothetical protein C2845_PM08G03890 [Panicum miliaceum]
MAKPSCVPPIQPVLSCLFKGVHKCHAKEEAARKKPGDGEADSADGASKERREPYNPVRSDERFEYF